MELLLPHSDRKCPECDGEELELYTDGYSIMIKCEKCGHILYSYPLLSPIKRNSSSKGNSDLTVKKMVIPVSLGIIIPLIFALIIKYVSIKYGLM